MSEFNNITITCEANIHFNGDVTSRTIIFANGSAKTLGIMMPGEYTFATEKTELMQVLAGELSYRLDGSDEWLTVESGEFFGVPRCSLFDVKVSKLVDYCCSYIETYR